MAPACRQLARRVRFRSRRPQVGFHASQAIVQGKAIALVQIADMGNVNVVKHGRYLVFCVLREGIDLARALTLGVVNDGQGEITVGQTRRTTRRKRK